MRTYRVISTLFVCALVQLGLSSKAHAIALPDNTAANCNTVNGCFKITNTNNTGRPAIVGTVTAGTGVGVNGVSPGTGVSGQSTASGAGVIGVSASGFGGLFSVQGGSAAAVYGFTQGAATGAGVQGQGSNGVYGNSTHMDGFGVIGRNSVVGGAGNGAAVYGDASASPGTIWGGRFDGDVFGWDFYGSNFFPSSDARLKKDIQDLPHGLTDILKLRPVTFKWKQPESGGEGMQVGLIAQDVQKIIPELVRSRLVGQTLSLNYDGLAPVLIKAVQEQQKLIEKQAARIDALERGGGNVLSSLASTPSLALLLGLAGAGTFLSRRRRQSEQK